MPEKKLGIIGIGNMGSAILQGVMRAKLYTPDQIIICDIIQEKVRSKADEFRVAVADNGVETAEAASTLLLAVKPQTMDQCLSELNGAVGPSHLVISIAAGITTSFIERRLGERTRVVRVMPNTPALVSAGASALCPGANAKDADLDATEKIFAALGKVYRVAESAMDAVTAVSGSGPAYLFLFAECLERAALECGIPETHVADLIGQTLFGAAKLLAESDDGAPVLRAKVTSPGGTTEAAVAVLTERGFCDILSAAVKSAAKRAKELGGSDER